MTAVATTGALASGPAGPTGPAGAGSVNVTLDSLSGSPRSVTDWGAIINTAIGNGTRHFVLGDFEYLFSTPIDVRNLYGVVFEGARSRGWVTTASYTFSWARGSRLVYTGGASPHVTASDGAITSGQRTLTSASGPFEPHGYPVLAAGAPITIAGAGPAGATLTTKIESVQSATQVTLAAAASTTVTGAAIDFIDWDSAINAQGSDGLQFHNLGLFYNNSAFDGILLDVRFKDTWSSEPQMYNCQCGAATYSDFSWQDYSLNNAYTLLHLSGMGARASFTDCTFAGGKAAVRGMYQGNSDDVSFTNTTFYGFNEGFIVNPGRWWKFKQCLFGGNVDVSSRNSGPVFTDDTYPGDLSASVTLDDCSFWDWNQPAMGPMIVQHNVYPWYLKLQGETLFWSNSTSGPDIQMHGPGGLWIDALNMDKDATVPGIDVGDAQAGAKKDKIYISGIWPQNADAGLIINADTGHVDVCIEDALSPQLKYVSGHRTQVRTNSLMPAIATASGQTALASSSVFGTDRCGRIAVSTTSSGAVAGDLVTITFAHAWPSWEGESDPNSYGTACPFFQECKTGGNGSIGSNIADTFAAEAYPNVTDNDTTWTLAIKNPVSGAKNLAWFYWIPEKL